MKRISGVAILLFYMLCGVCAAPFEIDAGLAVHDSSLYSCKLEESLRISYDGFAMGANIGGREYINVAASYGCNPSSWCTLRADAHLSHTFDTGGFATLSGEAGLKLGSAPFFISCGLGIQAGLSYSLYANDYLPFSLSPYVVLRTGLEAEYFRIAVFTTGSTFFLKTFQAVPIAGVDIGIGISEGHWILLEAYVRLADYMDGPPLQITDIAARIGYSFRTDI